MKRLTIIHSVGDKEVADKGLETLHHNSRIKKVSRKTPSHSQGGQSEHNNQLKYGSVLFGAEYEAGE